MSAVEQGQASTHSVRANAPLCDLPGAIKLEAVDHESRHTILLAVQFVLRGDNGVMEAALALHRRVITRIAIADPDRLAFHIVIEFSAAVDSVIVCAIIIIRKRMLAQQHEQHAGEHDLRANSSHEQRA